MCLIIIGNKWWYVRQDKRTDLIAIINYDLYLTKLFHLFKLKQI